MIIDLNILKRLGKRFGVYPVSKVPELQQALSQPQIFIKAPAGLEPAFTGGGYEWDDEINGYRLGNNQKLFLLPNGITVWIFKDVLARGLSLDSIQKWTSGDAEYPMGKANAFFIVYGKLTGQDLGEGETAGDNVPDGETEPDEGGGLATAEPEGAPFSKQDVQAMLKGDFGAAGATPKQSMDTAIPSAPVGPPPDRSKVGKPLPPETGSEAERIIKTLYKQAKIDPKAKLSKQNPIRLDPDAIIDLYQRAKTLPPEEGEKLIAFLKSGAIKPLEEGKITKQSLEGLVGYIVEGIVGEINKAKEKAQKKKWTEKFQGRKEKAEEDTLDEMTTTSGGGGSSAGTPGYNIPGAFGRKMSRRKDHIEVLGYKMTPEGEKEYEKPADKLYEAIKKEVKKIVKEAIVQKPVGKCPHCGKDIWSKDAMVCSSCKKQLPPKTEPKPGSGGISLAPLQQEASGLGPDFDRAQRAYDRQMPPESDDLECPQCGGESGYYTEKGHRAGAHWYSAECPDCGHTWGDDNFDSLDDR